MGIIKF